MQIKEPTGSNSCCYQRQHRSASILKNERVVLNGSIAKLPIMNGYPHVTRVTEYLDKKGESTVGVANSHQDCSALFRVNYGHNVNTYSGL
jgi:hypothetical protein